MPLSGLVHSFYKIMVKYMIYNSNHSQDMLLDQIDEWLTDCAEEFDESLFVTMCGTICHVMLHNIPEYDLVDKHKYTIEMICYNVPVTLSKSLHTFLDCLSEICVNGLSESLLLSVLTVPELASVILLGGLPMRKLYCVTVKALATIRSDSDLCNMANIAMRNDNIYKQLNHMFGG